MANAPARRRRFRQHAWEPLTMTWAEVADAVFRRNEAWLHDNLPDDFPAPDPIYGLFHVEAVEAWARRRWGLVTDATSREDAQAILRERLRGTRQGALSGHKAA